MSPHTQQQQLFSGEETCSIVKQIRTGECCVDVIRDLPSSVEYIYEEPIGKGGGGRIYLVEYSGARHALKISHENDDSQVKVECEVLPQLCHPNIIKCAAIDVDKHSFLMQFADRSTLAQFITDMHEKYVTLPALLLSNLYVRLLIILAQVAKGMQYLHSQRCVHRDLNPRNVLLCSKEGYKLGYMATLSDFGACYMEGNQISAVNSVKQLGTPQYAAPEQLSLQSVEEIMYQSDVYSYGVLVWTSISGQQPWDELKNAQEVVGYVVGQQQTLPIDQRWPVALKKLISQCFSRDPLLRPSWDQIMKLLKEENDNVARIKKLSQEEQQQELAALMSQYNEKNVQVIQVPKNDENIVSISQRSEDENVSILSNKGRQLLKQSSFGSQQSSQGSSEPQPSPFSAAESQRGIILTDSERGSESEEDQEEQQIQYQQQRLPPEYQLQQTNKQSSSQWQQSQLLYNEDSGEENKENIETGNLQEDKLQRQSPCARKGSCFLSTVLGIPVTDDANQCKLKKCWQQQQEWWCSHRTMFQQQNQNSNRWKNFFDKLVSSGVEGLSGSSRQLVSSNANNNKTTETTDIESFGNVQDIQGTQQQELEQRGWNYVRIACKLGWYTILAVAGVCLVFVLICLLF